MFPLLIVLNDCKCMSQIRFSAHQTAGLAQLTHRPLQDDDIPAICGFPQTAEELFFAWHGADWPLTPDGMRRLLPRRVDPTVFLLAGAPVGFAALGSFHSGISCGLGSVMVSSRHRGHGIGRYLLRVMVDRALLHHRLPYMEIYCYAHNTRGVLLYAGAGIRPWRIEERVGVEGERIALIIFRVSYDEWMVRRTAA
jgi:GNAT superfamily N-acetyltransferase